jgi:hypothetical protein
MSTHPYNVINAMRLVGYSLADMLPGYPGKDEAYLDDLLRDNALSLSRPVMPYGLLGVHACTSRYFNVSAHGFRSSGQAQPWPPREAQKSIFFFGGSTTLGVGLEDGQTVPAKLQRRLHEAGHQCQVYNFGSGNYTSRHELLRFLDLLDGGITPDIAVFLDGFNDSVYAFGNPHLVNLLDSLYQREKKKRRESESGLWGLAREMASLFGGKNGASMPSSDNYRPQDADEAARFFFSEAGVEQALQWCDRPMPPEHLNGLYARAGKGVWERYLDSVEMIRAVARRRGAKTFFVWQPVSTYLTRKDHLILDRLFTVYRQNSLCSPVYQWLHHQGYPTMSGAPDFLNLSGLGARHEGVQYVDTCHYTASFCSNVAEMICKGLLAGGYLSD